MSRWHLYRQYLSWQLFSISWIAQLFLTQFWPNFLGALIFSDQNSFWPKIFLDPKFFGNQLFRPKIFREPILLDPNFLDIRKFWSNFFEHKIFFDSKLFQGNFKDDFTFTSTKLSSTLLGTTQPQLVSSLFMLHSSHIYI